MIKINKAKLVKLTLASTKPRAEDLWLQLLDTLRGYGIGCVQCHCAWNLRLTHRQHSLEPGMVVFTFTCDECKTTTTRAWDVAAVARAKPTSLYEYTSTNLARSLIREGWEFWPEREQECSTTVRVHPETFHAITAHSPTIKIHVKPLALGDSYRVMEMPSGVQYIPSPFAPSTGGKDTSVSLLVWHFDNLAAQMCSFCEAKSRFWCDWQCTRQPSQLEELFLRRWRPRLEHSSKT